MGNALRQTPLQTSLCDYLKSYHQQFQSFVVAKKSASHVLRIKHETHATSAGWRKTWNPVTWQGLYQTKRGTSKQGRGMPGLVKKTHWTAAVNLVNVDDEESWCPFTKPRHHTFLSSSVLVDIISSIHPKKRPPANQHRVMFPIIPRRQQHSIRGVIILLH